LRHTIYYHIFYYKYAYMDYEINRIDLINLLCLHVFNRNIAYILYYYNHILREYVNKDKNTDYINLICTGIKSIVDINTHK